MHPGVTACSVLIGAEGIERGPSSGFCGFLTPTGVSREQKSGWIWPA